MIQPDIPNHEPHIRIIRPTTPSSRFRPFSPLAKLLFEYMDEIGEGGMVGQRGCGLGVRMECDFRSESIECA
jgi:hypothetical protein